MQQSAFVSVTAFTAMICFCIYQVAVADVSNAETFQNNQLIGGKENMSDENMQNTDDVQEVPVSSVKSGKETSAHIWNKTKNMGEDVWTTTKDGTVKAWDKTKELGSEAWSATKEGSAKVWHKTKEMSHDAWNITKEAAEDVHNAMFENDDCCCHSCRHHHKAEQNESKTLH
ncbi:MAG: hypothetical protein VZR95_08585 [Alphaproteobacteria bacterium]